MREGYSSLQAGLFGWFATILTIGQARKMFSIFREIMRVSELRSNNCKCVEVNSKSELAEQTNLDFCVRSVSFEG